MKYKKLTGLVLLGLLVNQPIGFSAPSGGVVISGGGQITTPSLNSTLINQTTNNLSINWNSFNINSNETVQFVQPSSNSIAVNNILSLDASTIAGQLNANGQIVLVNPNGLIFSQSYMGSDST